MQSRKTAAATMVAAFALALGGASIATAGSASYAVEVAPNGGVGGCQSSTGTMSNVTNNLTASAITIMCPTPNGFAWGRNLDTPDEVTDAALVDDGTDVAASWKQTGANNSKGRKLGLLMRVGDMSVKSTGLEFADDQAGDFASSFDVLPNGKLSKRANLKLRLPRGADLLDGTTARCKTASETAGIKWTTGISTKGNSFRSWQPTVLVDCSSLSAGTAFASNDYSLAPDPNNAKFLTGTATCATGQAVAGGYDVSRSTTSQWPQPVLNGPDAPDANGVSKTWRVTVAVPSQNSSTAKASMKVWVTCSK